MPPPQDNIATAQHTISNISVNYLQKLLEYFRKLEIFPVKILSAIEEEEE